MIQNSNGHTARIHDQALPVCGGRVDVCDPVESQSTSEVSVAILRLLGREVRFAELRSRTSFLTP